MYGKLLGAGIGGCAAMLLSWPPLVAAGCAFAGALLGHALFDGEPDVPNVAAPRSDEALVADSPRRRGPRRRPPSVSAPSPEQRTLIDALCPLFIEVARVDGEVVSDEVKVVREFFEKALGFDAAGLEGVRVALKEAIGAPVRDVEALVKEGRSAVKPALRVEVLRALYAMVLSDSTEMQRAEHDVLKRVVQHFNLSDEQLQQVTGEFFGSGTEHYDTLGVPESATDDELKAAFRRLAAEHHPDRVAALGTQEAEAAAARFRDVKAAWEALKRLRGL